MSSRLGIVMSPVALLVALITALTVDATSSRAADQALYVTFHANHTITVTLLDGTPVGTTSGPPTVIPAGDYTLHLDNSDEVAGPEFDISGPGVKVVDDLFFGEAPSATHRVTFQPSATYTWRDDARPSEVFVFTISAATPSGSSGSSSGTTTGSSSSGSSSSSKSSGVVGSGIKSVPFRGTLAGTVSTAGRLTLTRNGKGVSTIKSGRYKITIDDKTSRSGFTVQEIRKQPVAVTGVSFVGKRSVTVELKAGQWFFYSPSAGKKNYFVVSA
jgi:hypothetical protein